jgi:hypothetical protein
MILFAPENLQGLAMTFQHVGPLPTTLTTVAAGSVLKRKSAVTIYVTRTYPAAFVSISVENAP